MTDPTTRHDDNSRGRGDSRGLLTGRDARSRVRAIRRYYEWYFRDRLAGYDTDRRESILTTAARRRLAGWSPDEAMEQTLVDVSNAADTTNAHADEGADRVAAPLQRVRLEWPDHRHTFETVQAWDREDALSIARRRWAAASHGATDADGAEPVVRVEYCGPADPPPLAIPPDADRPCRHDGCDGTLSPDGPVHSLDEGDGTAAVDLACDTCSIQSVHYWELAEVEYRAQFGHDVDDQVGSDDPDNPAEYDSQPVSAARCGQVYPWAVDFDGSDLGCTRHDSTWSRHQTTDAHGDVVSWPDTEQVANLAAQVQPEAQRQTPDAYRQPARSTGPAAGADPGGQGDPWRPAAAELWRPGDRQAATGAAVEQHAATSPGAAPLGERIVGALPIRPVVGDVASLPAERTRSRYLAVTPTVGDDRCWQGWSVTHTPTGRRVGPALADPDDARALAERLRGLDWSSPDPQTYQTGYRRAVDDAYRGLTPATGRAVDPERAPAAVEQLATPVTLPDAQAAGQAGGVGEAVAAELRRLADQMDPASTAPPSPQLAGALRTEAGVATYLRIRANDLSHDQQAAAQPDETVAGRRALPEDQTPAGGDDTDQLYEHAVSAADEAIGLFAHYRDRLGADEQTARAQVTALAGDAIDRYLEFRQQPDLADDEARDDAANAICFDTVVPSTGSDVDDDPAARWHDGPPEHDPDGYRWGDMPPGPGEFATGDQPPFRPADLTAVAEPRAGQPHAPGTDRAEEDADDGYPADEHGGRPFAPPGRAGEHPGRHDPGGGREAALAVPAQDRTEPDSSDTGRTADVGYLDRIRQARRELAAVREAIAAEDRRRAAEDAVGPRPVDEPDVARPVDSAAVEPDVARPVDSAAVEEAVARARHAITGLAHRRAEDASGTTARGTTADRDRGEQLARWHADDHTTDHTTDRADDRAGDRADGAEASPGSGR